MKLKYLAEFIIKYFNEAKPSKEGKIQILTEKLEAAYKQGCIDTQHNIKNALGIDNVSD